MRRLHKAVPTLCFAAVRGRRFQSNAGAGTAVPPGMDSEEVSASKLFGICAVAAAVGAGTVVAYREFFDPEEEEEAQVLGRQGPAPPAKVLQQQLYVAKPSPTPRAFTQRAFSKEDLRWYDGVRNTSAAREAAGNVARAGQHPLPIYDDLVLMSVKGVVYSVSPEWYGPGSCYHAFAGKDCSRHLGKTVVGDDEANLDWTGMAPEFLEVLDDWAAKLSAKYTRGGVFAADDIFFSGANSVRQDQ